MSEVPRPYRTSSEPLGPGVYHGPVEQVHLARRIILVPVGEVLVPVGISLERFKPGMRVTLLYDRRPVATELRAEPGGA